MMMIIIVIGIIIIVITNYLIFQKTTVEILLHFVEFPLPLKYLHIFLSFPALSWLLVGEIMEI